MTDRRWLIGLTFIFSLLACSVVDEASSTIGNEISDSLVDEDNTEDISTEAVQLDEEEVEVSADPLNENADEGSQNGPPAECPFQVPAGMEITCGYLMVPENRTRSDPPVIELAYAVVHAEVDEDRPPIIYLAGGPGGSAIDDFISDPQGWDYEFMRSRDLILIDQRGTGFSSPSLDCPELAEETDFFDENPEIVCHERLVSHGIDLTAYNTTENAADIEALRKELGVAAWDLLGISYGTRLAMNIMRDHPQGIRSVVLDSVFPPNADTPGDEAHSPLWSLERLFTECAADTYCSDAYPDLEEEFLGTVLAMNEAPIDDIYGDDLMFFVTNALNDTSMISLVPYVINEVVNGNIGALEEITDDAGFGRGYQGGEDRSDSEGMYNSVICHEEYIFNDYESVEKSLIAAAPQALEAALLQPIADLYQVCSYWGAGQAGAIENEPVFSAIPTLLLAGQYDHATPTKWAKLAAETLPNAYLYEFPGSGHSLLSGERCAISITNAFLNAPEQEPDTSCLDAIEWPYFE